MNFFLFVSCGELTPEICPHILDTVHTPWAGTAQSVQRFDIGWRVWGQNPIEGEIFRTRPDRPWGPSSLLYNGYRDFLGRKAAGAWS